MRNSDTSATLKDDLACIACHARLCQYAHTGAGGIAPLRLEIQRGERLECLTGNCLKFWSIVRGTAAVCTVLADGRRQIIALARSNDVICGLLADGTSPHWLEALDTCEICEIDFTPCAAELAQEPSFMHAMMDIMHGQLVRTSQHLITLGRLDSTERVIFFLAQIALSADTPVGGKVAVQLPMSREDIADYLGLNSETVSRILTKLRKQRLVRFLNRSEFVIPDMAALERRLPLPLRREDAAVIGQFADDDTNGAQETA